MIKDACSQGYVLPTFPATITLSGMRNPEVGKATDALRIRIWNSRNGDIAELTTAKSPSIQITTGQVSNFNLQTPTAKINSLTDFNVSFTFQHDAITDLVSGTPANYPAKIEITLSDVDFQVSDFIRIKSTNIPGASITVENPNKVKNKIVVFVTTPQIKAQDDYGNAKVYYLELTEIKLAGSK